MSTTSDEKIQRRTYTLREAAEILGYPRSTAYDLVKRNEFPVPVIRGARTIRVARALVDAIAPSLETRTSYVCGCGSQVSPEDKFCGECGRPIVLRNVPI